MADDNQDVLGKAYVQISVPLAAMAKDLSDAKNLFQKALDDMDKRQKESADKTSGLSGAITGYYKKHEESIKAATEAAALFVGGVVAVGAAVVELGARGAVVNDVREAFDQLTASAGDTQTTMDGLRKASGGVITDFNLMKSVNQAFSQGLQLNQADLDTTAQAAFLLSKRIGGDATEAYDTLMKAMATGRDMTLKNVGVNIDAKHAVDEYAASVGKATGDLSEHEVKAVKTAAIMGELRKVVTDAGGSERDFADRLDAVKVGLQNVTDNLGVAIATSPVLNVALDHIADAMMHAFGDDQTTQIQTLVGYVNQGAIALVSVGEAAVLFGKYAGFSFYGVRAAVFTLLEGMASLAAFNQKMYVDAALMLAKIPGVGTTLSAQMLLAAKGLINNWSGFAQSFKETASGAIDDAAKWDVATDKIYGGLEGARAAMLAVMNQAPKTGAAVKGAGQLVKSAGDDVVVSAEEWKKFNDQLRSIAADAENAKQASLLTGTQARLKSLQIESQAARDAAVADAKTTAMGQQLSTAITAAEAVKRAAILEDENRSVEGDVRKANAAIVQSDIAASETGLKAQLDALDAEQKATRDDATFQGYSADALAKELEAIDRTYAAKRRALLADNERQIANDRASIAKDAAGIVIDLTMSGVPAALAANDLELKDKLRTIALEKNADQRLTADTVALYKLKAQQIIAINDPIYKAWQGLTADMRQDWADTFTSALQGETSWMDAFLKPFKDFRLSLEKIFAGILADLMGQFMAPLQQMLGGLMSGIAGGVGGGSRGAGGAALGGMNLSNFMQGGTHVNQWGETVPGMSNAARFGGGAMMAGAGIAAWTQATGAGSSAMAGMQTGAGIGTMIMPGIGTAIGAGVGAVAGLISNALSNKARDSVKSFGESFGGLDKLHDQLTAALSPADANKLWIQLTQQVGKDQNKAQAAIAAVTQALNDAQAAQQRWNLTAEDKKPADAAKDLATAAESIVADFTQLTGQGFDPTKVTGKMADALNALGMQAETTGQQLPASIKPLMDSLIKSGMLSDDLKAKLMGVAADSVPDWQALQSTAEKYGISIDALGPKFQKTRIADVANGIATDFKNLIDAGGDVNGVLSGMKDEVQGVVTDALRFGVDVPEAMKPMLEQMVNLGMVTDENGNALTDLSRLNFSKPLEDSVDALIKKMDELITGMTGTGGLANVATIAAGDAADGIRKAFDGLTVDVGVGFGPVDPGAIASAVAGAAGAAGDGAGANGGNLPSFANGGIGDFGSGTLAMLHGQEAIFPLDRLEAAIAADPRPAFAADMPPPQMTIQVQQSIALDSPDAGAMRRLVRGDLKDELLQVARDDVDGWGRSFVQALARFQEATT